MDRTHVNNSLAKYRQPKRPLTPRNQRPTEFILHYNGATHPCIEQEPGAYIRGVCDWHMDGNGWNYIAYNYIIANDGVVYKGRGHEYVNGANGVKKYNKSSIAVLFQLGAAEELTNKMKQGFKRLYDYIHTVYTANTKDLVPAEPKLNILGHQEVKKTPCPGDSVMEAIKYLRGEVNEELPIPATSVDIPSTEWGEKNILNPKVHAPKFKSKSVWEKIVSAILKVLKR